MTSPPVANQIQPAADNLVPSDTRRSLPIALLQAREAIVVKFRPLLAKHGFTEQQWRVLRVLAEAGEIDASALAQRACILAPSLTRIIRTLESRKLLVREISQADGRKLILKPTELAHQHTAAIVPEALAIYNVFRQQFGDDQIEQLLDMLNNLTDTNS